ncbi:hypothetical protein HOLleu_43960 [Holothuria leucospilota]|uniref:Uncharacterized protein n=1 Tax=Holothuria leucospilota TaxID=206669 RepID=A0A9Q0YA64_HOLLE|nr:hypothetical protein HOLleu_43960 [Holothuria leucospilota]
MKFSPVEEFSLLTVHFFLQEGVPNPHPQLLWSWPWRLWLVRPWKGSGRGQQKLTQWVMLLLKCHRNHHKTSETSTQLPPNASAVGSTAYSEPATTTLPSAEPSSTETGSLVALQQQVNLLQSQVEMLGSQPTSLQRATELRQLKFQEELLKLEKKEGGPPESVSGASEENACCPLNLSHHIPCSGQCLSSRTHYSNLSIPPLLSILKKFYLGFEVMHIFL